MRRQFLALGFLLLGLAVLGTAAGWGSHDYFADIWPAVLWSLGAILLIAAGLIAASAGAPATIRVDWFLPFLRKQKKGQPLGPLPWPFRMGRQLLPTTWFADRTLGKPGRIRKWLKWLGPSVLSSPLRRLVQAFCFVLFLVLFFHVCWPYSAQPARDGAASPGWRLLEIDSANGDLVLQNAVARPSWLTRSQPVYLDPERQGNGTAVALRMVDPIVDPKSVNSKSVNSESNLRLQPQSQFTNQQLDALLTSAGPWTLYETPPGRWPSHYRDNLARKEWLPAELFLAIDPLVSLSTAIASRSWVWSLGSAAVILIVCVLIPRGFCGYLCPLGTLIDMFDWAVAGRVKRFQVPDEGWWVHIKYYLLAAILVSATMGVLISGYVAAIPVITRGVLFIGEPLQTGIARNWYQVPPMNGGHFFSIGMFLAVLGLGFLRPRFWCKYVCPSGAIFSLGNLFRMTERKVESSCINCNKCVEICPFDAIKPDFTTRVSDCTMCQTCGGVCPTHAIKFVDRWNGVELKVLNDPPTGDTTLGRRGFLALAAGSAAALAGGASVVGVTRGWGANLNDPQAFVPVRPPGSVPEREFLQMCIRCGECFKACPNNVLQSEGLEQGLEGLWTPMVVADWAGCESSCNACGQVCPTGAIRALPLEEKKVARMGLAIVNQQTCLPLANREACDLCVVECNAAGYRAIEFMQVHTVVDDQGQPVPGTGYLAPVVLADKCVGCGLCQTRCYLSNAKERKVLTASAIVVEAGEGNEDRLMRGSYQAIRKAEAQDRQGPSRTPVPTVTPKATPKARPSGETPKSPTDDPFGIGDRVADPFGLDP